MRNILYHPYIEFNDADYQWLIKAALFWDNIYRIVPENYAPLDNDNIKALSDEGVIRKVLVKKDDWELVELRDKASEEFLADYGSVIDGYAAKNPQWEKNAVRFNVTKADCSLIFKLEAAGLVIKKEEYLYNNDWVFIPKSICDGYMSYLAKYIAEANQMSLATPDSSSWLNASDVLKGRGLGEKEALAFPVSINDIIPKTFDISIQQLLEFRKKHRDERLQFNRQCEEFAKKLSRVQSIEVLKDIWNDECVKIEKAAVDYKKCMGILKVTKFAGGLSFLGSVVGQALSGANLSIGCNITNFVTLGLGVVIEVAEKAMPDVGSYSYLYDVHKLAPREFRKKSIIAQRI